MQDVGPMNRNKICPDCECEYLPHIRECADCGAALILIEEHRSRMEEQKRLMEKALKDAVVVREGDLKWLGELYHVLIASGIACSVQSGDSCKKSCRNDKYHLLVESVNVDRALERIEEYFAEMHPEIRASQELMNEGKCPACGSPVAADAHDCQDCGLPLLIIEGE
jgi:hypothetical protein